MVRDKKSNLNKLQHVQSYAARIIIGNFDYMNTLSIDLLPSLRWSFVEDRCDLVHKIYHPTIQMYLNGHLYITEVSSGIISLMKSGWVSMLNGYTSVLFKITCMKTNDAYSYAC